MSASPPPPGWKRKRFHLSITLELLLGYGGLIFLAVAAVLALAVNASSQNTVSLMIDKAELVMDGLEMRVRSQLEPARYQAEYLAGMISRGEVDSTSHASMETALRAALAAAPQITGVGFVDPRGFWLSARRPTIDSPVTFGIFPDPVSTAEAMEIARLTDGPVWTDPEWVADLKASFLTVRVPVRRNGQLIGAVVTGVSFQDLSRFLQDLQTETGEHAFILFKDDHVLAHPELVGRLDDFADARQQGLPPLPLLSSLTDPIARAIWTETDSLGVATGRGGARAGTAVDVRIGGTTGDPPPTQTLAAGLSMPGSAAERLTALEFRDATVPIPRPQNGENSVDEVDYFYLLKRISSFSVQPWVLVIAFDADTVNREANRVLWLFIIGVCILIGSVVLSLLLGRGISREIRQLSNAALALRTLDFRNVPELTDSRYTEISEAANAFNTLIGGLRWFETYVPKSLVLRLMRRDVRKTGVISEERTVTVMFTDIRGFSAMAETMNPVEMATLLNSHFNGIATCIEAEGGTVDKFIGDAIMAFWGAPEDQPDHACRALRAARAIAELIERQSAEDRAAGRPTLSLRIGIHSGPVVVGNIGTTSRLNYTIVGDTVNAAARLEALGSDMADDHWMAGGCCIVLTSGDTMAAAGAAAGDCPVAMRQIGDYSLRGRAGIVTVWRMDGTNPSPDAEGCR
jgi:adenylate cyclase